MAFETAVKPLIAGVAGVIEYLSGDPVVAVKGKLKLVEVPETEATDPKVMVGTVFTVADPVAIF